MRVERELVDAVRRFYHLPASAEEVALWAERFGWDARLIEELFSIPVDSEGEPAVTPRWAPSGAPAPEPGDGTREETAAGGPPAGPISAAERPARLGAVELARRIRRGELSPVEVTEATLRAIEADREWNAWIHVFASEALDEARRQSRSLPPGPLAGVPVAVKDLMRIAGYRMTGGSRALDGPPAERDAEPVRRLREAGAIVIGAANLHELAFGTTNENPHFGRAANPHHFDHISGGSSGGSAVAVGRGMAAAALGTDTGGSIRIPAACCGLAGLKPTYDLVSRDGVFPLGWTLDHVGPIAPSVEDAALLLEVLTGRMGAYRRAPATLAGCRLGVPEDFFQGVLHPDVRRVYEEALRGAERAGARLVRVRLPLHEHAPAIYYSTSATEACTVHRERLLERPDRLGPDVRLRLATARFVPAQAYVRAQQLRTLLRREQLAALEWVDALVTPTLAAPAPEKGSTQLTVDGVTFPVPALLLRYTSPFNLTGLPAVTLPAGRSEKGLPIGVQLAGRPYDESRILAVARALEKEWAF